MAGGARCRAWPDVPVVKRKALFFVNVTVENLAPCQRLVRVEVDAQQVDATFEEITKDFSRQAALPGFRPGKAPRSMVVKRYEKEIQEEVRRKLMPKAYQEAMQAHKFEVLGEPDVEEIQFAKGQPLQLAIKVEIVPQFDLPEYKGLAAKRETQQVADADIDRALGMLQQRETKYETVARPLQTGDVVVVNYSGTVDGKSILELAPASKGLAEQKSFWIRTEPDNFIPGFAPQLLGAQAGDKRTVTVDFPADFVTPQLAGLKGVYEVEILEVKASQVPPLDDEFAKRYEAADLATLRAGVRTDLENELNSKKQRSVRSQLMDTLLARVDFELPESALKAETQRMIYNIVSENQQRGVPKEVIDGQKEAVFQAASNAGRTRVKINFILRKIIQAEGLQVTQEEVSRLIYHLATVRQIPVEEFVADLKERNAVGELYDQVATEKAFGVLEANAVIEDVPPGTLSPAPEAPAQA